MGNAHALKPRRILVIRRDNIGDLVCTTPLLASLRKFYPDAWLGVLANAYNAEVLAGNPDIDNVFAYRKAKHRGDGETKLGVWLATARLIWQLRRRRIDLALCASPGARRFAQLIGARRIVEGDRTGQGHEVEITFRLLEQLGLSDTPGPLVLTSPSCSESDPLCLAVHISARKPRQRWPLERHAALIRRLLDEGRAARVLLFWAPGQANDPQHPGDDDQAAQLLAQLKGLAVTPMPTHTLRALIDGLAQAAMVICSDGGAMHIAAALGKPIVCFFGNSSAERWHPWKVPYELLQKSSRQVADIAIEEAYAAVVRLQERTGQI